MASPVFKQHGQPQLLAQSSGPGSTTKMDTAQVWVRPWRRECSRYLCVGCCQQEPSQKQIMNMTACPRERGTPHSAILLHKSNSMVRNMPLWQAQYVLPCILPTQKTIQKITMRTWRLWVKKCNLHIHLKEVKPVRQFLAYTQQNVPKYSVPEPAVHVKTQSEQGCLWVPSSLCTTLCEGTNMQAFER